ncbi:MAG: hypothetical protein OEY36_13625 [Gammaproteobacteria bacterium]|nr:hypothetical protein [Gammaproteobacteria bacterium]
MIFRKYFKITLMFISVVLTACSTASKSDNPGMAVIKGIPGWNPLSVIKVEVYSVDGENVSLKNNKLELKPGSHELKTRCRREEPETVQKYYRFKLQLKAGHQYKPKLDMTQDCYFEYEESVSAKRFKPLSGD